MIYHLRVLAVMVLVCVSEAEQYIWRERVDLKGSGDEITLLVPESIAKVIERVSGMHATVETNGCEPDIVAPFFGPSGQHAAVHTMNSTAYSIDWKDTQFDATPNVVLLRNEKNCASTMRVVITYSAYDLHTYSGNMELHPGKEEKLSVGYGRGLLVISLLINATFVKPCAEEYTRLSLVGHSGETVSYCSFDEYGCVVLSNDVNLHKRISLARRNQLLIKNIAGCPITIHSVEVIYKEGSSFPTLLVVVISVLSLGLITLFTYYRKRRRDKTPANPASPASTERSNHAVDV